MENQFVPYELALQLKELSFDEECIATIDQTEFVHIIGTRYPVRGSMMYDTISCPLWQQAFEFVMGILITNKKFQHYSFEIARDYRISHFSEKSDWTAVEIAYGKEECLKKLIELCKKK